MSTDLFFLNTFKSEPEELDGVGTEGLGLVFSPIVEMFGEEYDFELNFFGLDAEYVAMLRFMLGSLSRWFFDFSLNRALKLNFFEVAGSAARVAVDSIATDGISPTVLLLRCEDRAGLEGFLLDVNGLLSESEKAELDLMCGDRRGEEASVS